MSTQSRPDLGALRAEVARLQAGGRPHPPPQSSPQAIPSGDEPVAGHPNARDPHAIAKAIVLRQLANSPKTRAQLQGALAKRECDPEVAREVLDRLTEVGLVNDEAYAELYVRSKQNSRGVAKSVLRRELREKGVAADSVADVMNAVPEAAEEDRARALVRTRLPRLHGLDRSVQVRRLAGLLARKGYPSGLASRVVFEEIDQSAEHSRD